MTELTEKETLLESAGYRYHFDRMIYFNRSSRRALSLEFVEDHPLDEIKGVLKQKPDTNGWTFYFNSPPSERVQRELSEVLDS